MADLVQRTELAGFLRSKREGTRPEALGLEPGPRRRTPGLRREELALLSGVSTTWYTWLEQARPISVSRQVIESLARALQLGSLERAHLFTLAGLALPVDAPAPPEVDDTMLRLLHSLAPNPAYIVNPWWDILAYNSAYEALIGRLDGLSPHELNTIWLMFTEPRMAALFIDWNDEVRQLVGQLRAHLARNPSDPRGPELTEALQAVSSTFTQLWAEQRVDRFKGSRKRFSHPRLGRLDLDYVKLAATDRDQQFLIAFVPADAESAAALGRLALDGSVSSADT
ncbi:helix-turn-helix transcriptional regulator [Nocardioides sp. BP30]|nr:helix-turn-helix transcriptional regulator [Nocardioides sp. BP30]WGL51416.1 helix-turn-helix transcriptional regulator [Nocardioides sp. BP30]